MELCLRRLERVDVAGRFPRTEVEDPDGGEDATEGTGGDEAEVPTCVSTIDVDAIGAPSGSSTKVDPLCSDAWVSTVAPVEVVAFVPSDRPSSSSSSSLEVTRANFARSSCGRTAGSVDHSICQNNSLS